MTCEVLKVPRGECLREGGIERDMADWMRRETQIKRKSGETIEITREERKGRVQKSYDVLEGGRGKAC